jgi:AraC-like DNA-binding protein
MYNQISILRHHIYKATDHGADYHELCKRIRITPEQLSDGEAHLAWEPGENTDFWIHALELTGDPCLGLHMGEKPDKYNAFGMLGMLAGSCRNLREALEMIVRYNETLTGVFKFLLDTSGKDLVFSFNPHPLWEETNLESARQAVDMLTSSLLRSFHEACARKIYPLQIELRYPKRFPEEYQRIFKAPVLFNRPSNCFVFSKDDLESKLINYDQSLFTAFNKLLEQKQDQMESRQTVAMQIRHLLLTRFHGQAAHIDIVASTLCMTTRTLQRKLSEENTSYRDICNQLRRELAAELMKAGKSSKRQVATLLGYSDASTFNKAFKSWERKS